MTSADTNEVTTATTDAAGAYSIPLLRPGDYKLNVSAAGFKQFIRDRVVLEAAKVAGIDVTLEIGAVTDTVEVTAAAAVLDTQSASRGGVVTNQQVSELPLNARNPFMLGAMMSGVTFNGAAIWQRPFDNGAIAEWSINGSRNSSAEFTLDGASNNGQMGSNNIAAVPVVDAVQEFNVMTNMYNAEYGHTGGGVLNVVLKSGTNTHHITAWEFMRRTPLDANTFQNNAIVGTPSNPKGGAPRPNHYLDQYGWMLEGPLHIPGILRKGGPRLLDEIVRRVLAVARPDRIILFGSAATGQMTKDSDADLLVVEPEPVNTHERSVEIRDAVGNVGDPVDVIVMRTDRFERTKRIIGGIAYPANKYGRVIYAAA